MATEVPSENFTPRIIWLVVSPVPTKDQWQREIDTDDLGVFTFPRMPKVDDTMLVKVNGQWQAWRVVFTATVSGGIVKIIPRVAVEFVTDDIGRFFGLPSRSTTASLISTGGFELDHELVDALVVPETVGP